MTSHWKKSSHQRIPTDTRHADLGRRTAIPCPYCGAALRNRNNRELSSLVRQIRMVCLSEDCGAVFRGDLTITHVISPGARPDPAIGLKVSAPRRPANDDAPARHETPGGQEVPPPANDDGALTAIG